MRVIHKPANPLSGFQTGESTGFYTVVRKSRG
jgi:hypothetical protein